MWPAVLEAVFGRVTLAPLRYEPGILPARESVYMKRDIWRGWLQDQFVDLQADLDRQSIQQQTILLRLERRDGFGMLSSAC